MFSLFKALQRGIDKFTNLADEDMEVQSDYFPVLNEVPKASNADIDTMRLAQACEEAGEENPIVRLAGTEH